MRCIYAVSQPIKYESIASSDCIRNGTHVLAKSSSCLGGCDATYEVCLSAAPRSQVIVPTCDNSPVLQADPVYMLF